MSGQDSDSNSEADAIWGQAFGGENPEPTDDDHSQDKGQGLVNCKENYLTKINCRG